MVESEPTGKYKIRTVEQLASVIPTDTRADGQKWLPDQVRLLEVIKRKQKEAVDLEKIISDLKYVVIPAHENYERMFTITCHANWFNPTSHVVMGEVTFTRTKDGEGPIREIQKTAIEKIEVTPNSLVLGIFAASWSLVGIFFSYWAAGHPPESYKFPFVGHEAEVKWLDFTIIPAFAFVLYNILEFTQYDKLFVKQKLSWRTAMIVGILTGSLFAKVSAGIFAVIGKQ